MSAGFAVAENFDLKAPFPWFGGKSRVAEIVWDRFGDAANYVEPFAGSLAVLLGRPTPPGIETVNDLDCYIANFWRALRAEPNEVAEWADWPVNEADLHARHLWLVNRDEFRERMKTDPDYFDAKIAGWWVWGLSQWIGSQWCGEGARCANGTQTRQLPRLADAGIGVHRRSLHVDGLGNKGVHVHRKRPRLAGRSDRGVHKPSAANGVILEWFQSLAARLRRVRVCCGNWDRILGPSALRSHNNCAVFLDPPYSAEAGRDPEIYAADDLNVAHDVRAWAIEHGKERDLRIALCGYEGEYAMPEDWECVAWTASGGYGNQRRDGTVNENAGRERIWFSPHCLAARQMSLIAGSG